MFDLNVRFISSTCRRKAWLSLSSALLRTIFENPSVSVYLIIDTYTPRKNINTLGVSSENELSRIRMVNF